MTSYDEAVLAVTGPGAAFEIVADLQTGDRRFAATPRSLPELFGSRRDDRPFVWHRDRWWTFHEVGQYADALAVGLVDVHGIRPGDRVGILARNSPAWVAVFMATLQVGAVAVPLNTWWSADEVAYALSDCSASLLVVDAELADRALAGIDVVVLEESGSIPTGTTPLRPPPVAESDLATILYTSGTSGRPKGVVSTHGAVLQALWAFGCRAEVDRWRAEGAYVVAATARTLLPVPLFHVTGCVGVLLGAVRSGGQVVMTDRWDPAEALGLVERLGITHVVGVPTQWWDLLSVADLARYDLSSLERIGGGGAPAPPGLVQRLASLLGRNGTGIGYGMTETNGYGPVNAGEDHLAQPASCGRLVPIARIDIRDACGGSLPTGAVGEIWFRGPHLASGYWNDDVATDATWVDGWLRTGDVGVVDGDGFVFVTDRLKETIVRAGENVSVTEVEAALFGHPAVREAMVLAVPHERLGEEVGAVLVRQPGEQADDEAVRAWLRGRLASYKIPSRIRWQDEPLPRTASGKIAKAAVRRDPP